MKTTSTERMRKLRQKKASSPTFDADKHREKERLRIRELRKRQREKIKNDKRAQEALREKETARKRVYRETYLEKTQQSRDKITTVIERNKRSGRKARKDRYKEKVDLLESIRLHQKHHQKT